MLETPLVSVIVPVFNKQKYIRRCLRSLLNQSYANVEIILVDDCSTDASLCKAKRILHNRDKVTIIQNEENEGQLRARYAGLDVAKGEYTMFIDADDWIEPRAVEVLVRDMLANNVDLVQIRNQRRMRGMALKYKERFDPSISNRKIEGDEFRHIASYVGMDSYIYPACWGKLYITRKLREAARIEFNQFWGEDQIFNIQYLRECKSMYFSDYVGYNYRWGGQTTHYKYSALKEYKHVHHLKRMFGQDHNCINDEIKDLLKYHVRSLITELGYTREAVEMILDDELRDPLWHQVGLNYSAPELIDNEYIDIQSNRVKHIAKLLLK